MKKFEYKVTIGVDLGIITEKDAEKRLNKLGKKGWELMYYSANQNKHIYKRELIEKCGY